MEDGCIYLFDVRPLIWLNRLCHNPQHKYAMEGDSLYSAVEVYLQGLHAPLFP